jgi:hypothetical protein
MKRLTTTLAFACGLWLVHGQVLAQTTPDGEIKPNLNWVFLLSIVVLLGFLAFMAFVALYYVLAVIARNRKFATATVAAPGLTTAPIAQPAPAPVPAAPVPAAPIPAEAAPAPAQAAAPASAPAPAAAAPAPAATGGVPRIDPNNLPDGIDAVTRGRLKKLAVLQERGQEPPAELLKELEGVLGQVTPAAAAPAPAAAPAAPAAEAAAPVAETQAPAAEAAPAQAAPPPAPAADLGGLPHIDPNNLPDGIDAVTKGRLKKLAVFQERGQAPPADLVEKLKPVLDQMG